MTPEVKEFMEQLGFSLLPPEDLDGWLWYRSSDDLSISVEAANFFYNQFRLRELEAQIKALKDAKRDNMIASNLMHRVNRRISYLDKQIAQLEGGKGV